MPYVAPSTVTTLQTYTSAAHNIIVNDIIDHETRILALPRGYITHSTQTSNTNNIGTSATDTALTVTFTAVASRRYKLSFQGSLKNESATPQGGVGTFAAAFITDSANTIIGAYLTGYINSVNSGDRLRGSAFTFVTPSAGSVTYKVRAIFANGASNVFEAAATNPAIRLVEDIGAA